MSSPQVLFGIKQQIYFQNYIDEHQYQIHGGISNIAEGMEVINNCDWTEWFEFVEKDAEFSGVLLVDGNGNLVNPVLFRGTRYSVDCPEHPDSTDDVVRPIVTIHSHPVTDRDDDVDQLRPSISDWAASSGLGMQIIVTRWGLYIHEVLAKNVGYGRFQLMFGNMRWKTMECNVTNENYSFYFIPKDKVNDRSFRF